MNSSLTYDQISESSEWSIKNDDGRRMITFHEGDSYKTIYYYQWLWEKANGKRIQEGYCIHHRDFNHHNNRIENLQLMKVKAHMDLHRKVNHVKGIMRNTYICLECKKPFRGRKRKDRAQKRSLYCSEICYHLSRRKDENI